MGWNSQKKLKKLLKRFDYFVELYYTGFKKFYSKLLSHYCQYNIIFVMIDIYIYIYIYNCFSYYFKVISGTDPLDGKDFNPIDYINALFPTEQVCIIYKHFEIMNLKVLQYWMIITKSFSNKKYFLYPVSQVL